MKNLFLACLLHSSFLLLAQTRPFRFAFLSDTHIGSPNGNAEEDLRRTVADINAMKDIDFVVLTGDITELGKNSELKLAKQILDSLRIPYYIIPGNHDTGWNESGGLDFNRIFGDGIGGSNGAFYAMDISNGKLTWQYDGLKGPVVSRPVTYKDAIIFGAWDTHFYALHKKDGTLLWKWSNGSPVINYSPASCTPW